MTNGYKEADKYKENEKLLDNGGDWVYANDEAVVSFENKVVVGFLQNSHYNVMGQYSGGRNGGINGYACSHYRLLNMGEVAEYIRWEEKKNPKVKKFDLDLRDMALNQGEIATATDELDAHRTFKSELMRLDFDALKIIIGEIVAEDFNAWNNNRLGEDGINTIADARLFVSECYFLDRKRAVSCMSAVA